MAIGGHHNPTSKSDVWLTPPYILEALGPFDLDPCASVDRPWPTATHHYTVVDDGLSQPWFGRVWMNPPYGQKAAFWLRRLATHGNGTALIFARTETAMFFESVWQKATAMLFIEGRINFHFPDGRRASANSGAPSVLIAYGEDDAIALKNSGLRGAFVQLTVHDVRCSACGYTAEDAAIHMDHNLCKNYPFFLDEKQKKLS